MTALRRDACAVKPCQTSTPAALWTEIRELLWRCGRELRGKITSRTEVRGISESQFSVLWACAHGPPQGLSQGEISAASGVSPAHVSGLVEQLRTTGWLAGHRRPPDRRRQVWQLTPAGSEGLRLLLADLADWAAMLDRQLTVQRRGQLLELLQQLSRLLAPTDAAEPTPLRVVTGTDALPMAPGKDHV